ncbi:glycine betaine ABC transporter substrate-binding protein [Rothia dentocariosa]|uniref:glycine betaine ABC transporter substrate-binding protein n=1 Tax=Rothia dentocariosa TaxID=2047 RepID=UPI000A4B801D|nr:glycine betaine ABC transporter substrate-binding protein [Rothia dentocariosa]
MHYPNRPAPTRRTMISVLALAPLLAACSSEDDKPKVDPSASSYGTLRVGIGALREMRAVAYLYAQALRNVGYNVEVVTNEDSRSKFLDALKQTEANTPEPDTLDLVIDYSGDLLLHLTNDGKLSPAQIQAERQAASASASAASAGVTLPPTPTNTPSHDASASEGATASPSGAINARALNITDTVAAINRVLPEHLELLDVANAQNRDVLVTTRQNEVQHKLRSLANLADVKATLSFALTSGYTSSNYGVASLKTVYKYTVENPILNENSAERVSMLSKDTAQVVLLHSADPAIEDNRFTTLEDPQTTQLNQQLLPIARRNLPDSAREAINRVSSTLDTGNLSFLLRLTSGTNPIADDEAAKFLLEHPRK